MECPDPDELARFADGQAPEADREALAAHVDQCAICREVLVALAQSSRAGPAAPPVPVDDLPEKGTVIGRYVVLESQGAGGMGLVVSAYDAQLDRKVALKMVRPDVEAQGGAERTRARLMREAQLMARVRHPNVVTVYDFFPRGEQVVLAMELVEGHTLRAWLKEKPRTEAEIVTVFLQAGRALEAAHAAGVVHRDFKPDNVLINQQGQALVTDFGLAWSGAPPSGTPLVPAGEPMPKGHATGIVGTPAYMAPEQLKGENADGLSDQFSFCVALFEALSGQRPYQADDMRGLERAIAAGQIAAPPKKIPARLDAAIRRGLSADRAARFPDMGHLLAQLAPRTRRVAWAAAAVVLAAATATVATALVSRPGPGCDPGQAPLLGVWDPPRRAEVERGFQQAAGTASFPAVAKAFDRRADDWLQSWKTACESTRVKHTQSEEALSRQRVCLDARLDEMRALSDLLKAPGPGVVENAGLAVSRLKSAQACLTGEEFLALPLPQDPRSRQTIAQARLELARAQARLAAGQGAEALATAEQALALARLAHYPPVEAEAHLALVDPLRELGRYPEAEKALADAALSAEAGRHFEVLLHVAVKHIRVIDSTRVEEADGWIRRAEAALEHSPRPDLQAEVDSAVSILRLAQHKNPESRARASAALKAYEALGDVADALGARHIAALALRAQGDAALARTELSATLAAYQQVLGPTHPLTLHVRMHRCEALLDLGLSDEAQAELEGAELKGSGRLTPPWEVVRLELLGDALRLSGQLRSALVQHRQALQQSMTAGGGARISAGARVHLAATLRELEQLPEAEAELVQALAVYEAPAAPAPFAGSVAKLELAEVRLAQGRGADALALATAASLALGSFSDAKGPEWKAGLLTLAGAAQAVGDADLALRTLDGLLATRASNPVELRALVRRGLLVKDAARSEADLKEAMAGLTPLALFPLDQDDAMSGLVRLGVTPAPCIATSNVALDDLGPKARARVAQLRARRCGGQ